MDRSDSHQSTVLVIDDDPDIVEVIRLVFEDAGYNVIGAGTAEEAFESLSSTSVDIITLDIKLPGISGWEFLKRIKNDKEFRNIPIIVISGRGEEEDRLKGFQLGATDYVLKPFSPRELAARLAAHLRYTTAGMVVRCIEFPPEYHSAGVNILSYFSTFLRKNYPNSETSVKIEQEGLKVRMILDPLDGDRVIIEKALSDYGRFFCGELPAEGITNDKLLILELKQQRRIAEMQLEYTRDLLEIERRHNQQLAIQSKSVNEQYYEVVKSISRSLESKPGELKELKAIINSVARNISNTSRDALILLEKKLEKGITEKDKQEVTQALATLKEDEPDVFERVRAFIESAASGVLGNYIYNWMVGISISLPK